MPDTIGQKLKHTRVELGKSLEEAAQATRIRSHYLNALEEDRVDGFPSAVHRKGFLRNYAAFLGLDLERGAVQVFDVPEPADLPLPTPPVQTPEQLSQGPGSHPQAAPQFLPQPDQPDHPDPEQASQQKFAEIGRRLHAQREHLGLSLLDVESHTHLRLHYLKAIEEGDLNSLPSMVQSRGMLANYAAFLNLDPDSLLDLFAEALQIRRQELAPSGEELQASARKRKSARPASARPFQRIFSLDLLLGSGLIIFLVTFVIWATTQVLTMRTETGITQEAPGISELLLGTPAAITSLTASTVEPGQATTTITPSLDPAAVGLTGTATLPADTTLTQGNIQVYVVARARAWMRVTVDRRVQFVGRTQPGSAYPFGGNQQIEIQTGNAAALQVYYNQNDLGSLGGWSEVVDLIFTVDGQVTPTPTITPTVTRTPRTTPTLNLPSSTTPTPGP